MLKNASLADEGNSAYFQSSGAHKHYMEFLKINIYLFCFVYGPTWFLRLLAFFISGRQEAMGTRMVKGLFVNKSYN